MLFLFLDTETTSLSCQTGQIIELGATLCQFETRFLQVGFGQLNFVDENCEFISNCSRFFQEISRFETLIKLRQELDDKTTRITGIDQKILQNGFKLEVAQQLWQTWLETELISDGLVGKSLGVDSQILPKSEQINSETKEFLENSLIIVGHSLDFDLSFLRHEGWFLPKFKTVDTLELSKIFLPEMEAVNLEFLTKQLNLIPKSENKTLVHSENTPVGPTQTQNLENLELQKLEKTSQTFHRALFDSICCQNLLAFLLAKIVYHPIPSNLTLAWQNQLNQFLPNQILDLLPSQDLEGQNLDQNKKVDNSRPKNPVISVQNLTQKTKIPITIELNGQISQNLSDRIQTWSQQVSPESLSQILEQQLPRGLSLLVLQLVWLAFTYQNESGQQQPFTFKLHVQKEYLTIAELFCQSSM